MYYDVIVLSQSCDLVKDEIERTYKINDVVVCPVTALHKHIEANIFTYVPTKMKPDKKGNVTPEMVKGTLLGNIINFKAGLARGHYFKYYLLNKCEDGYFDDYVLVNLNDTFTIDIQSLSRIAYENGERIRLQSPYNEALSQAFGLRYMRVAQPIVIDKEKFPKEDIPSSVLNPLTKGIPDNLFDQSTTEMKRTNLDILFGKQSEKSK